MAILRDTFYVCIPFIYDTFKFWLRHQKNQKKMQSYMIFPHINHLFLILCYTSFVVVKKSFLATLARLVKFFAEITNIEFYRATRKLSRLLAQNKTNFCCISPRRRQTSRQLVGIAGLILHFEQLKYF